MEQLQRAYVLQFLALVVNKVLVCFSEPQMALSPGTSPVEYLLIVMSTSFCNLTFWIFIAYIPPIHNCTYRVFQRMAINLCQLSSSQRGVFQRLSRPVCHRVYACGACSGMHL